MPLAARAPCRRCGFSRACAVVRSDGRSRSELRMAAMQSGIFPPAPDLGGAQPRSRWNAAALAFLGDSVWEVYMRHRLLDIHRPQHEYARAVVRCCNNRTQAVCFGVLQADTFLSDQERDLLRWAANSSTIQAPANASSREYKQASAVEVLAAHLYLTDQPRLEALLQHVCDLPGFGAAEEGEEERRGQRSNTQGRPPAGGRGGGRGSRRQRQPMGGAQASSTEGSQPQGSTSNSNASQGGGRQPGDTGGGPAGGSSQQPQSSSGPMQGGGPGGKPPFPSMASV